MNIIGNSIFNFSSQSLKWASNLFFNKACQNLIFMITLNSETWLVEMTFLISLRK